MIYIKRIYEPPEKKDGYRILIDRLWPRGIAKQEAKIDVWVKEIAPSTELRKWFNHDAVKWKEFKEKYQKELKNNLELVHQIKALEKENKTITLLFAAKETEYNNAQVLIDVLKEN
ncbi:MAG: hypothetical protein AMXMBFR79_06070 [Chitinophagaceae bacterium]|nr:DUF488 family protein [Chitinophagales bacterium]